MRRRNDSVGFHYLKKTGNTHYNNRIIEGLVRPWGGDWSFELKLPGLTSSSAEDLVYRIISSLESSKSSLSTMFKETPEPYLWEKAVKSAIGKQFNARRVFLYQMAPKAYEFRYTRRTHSTTLGANLETIDSAIKSGATLSFVYPGETTKDLPSTRFVKPLALELSSSGEPYLRANRISVSDSVTRNYLVNRGESYVVQSPLKPLPSWHVKFRRSTSTVTTDTISAEIVPIR